MSNFFMTLVFHLSVFVCSNLRNVAKRASFLLIRSNSIVSTRVCFFSLNIGICIIYTGISFNGWLVVLQVNELKQELEARGQTSKGLKSQLQARLQKLLKGEEDAEGANKTDGEAAEDAMDADKEVSALDIWYNWSFVSGCGSMYRSSKNQTRPYEKKSEGQKAHLEKLPFSLKAYFQGQLTYF
jgi:hypothetical protein